MHKIRKPKAVKRLRFKNGKVEYGRKRAEREDEED
jgi:hypothetical protein